MKKLYKSPPPNELTTYAASYPTDRWDDFCTHAAEDQRPGDDYRAIKRRLIDDQGGLCGYCEQKVGDHDSSLQRIEHYHPKSDKSDQAVNWALLWPNILLVCTGGEGDGANYSLPKNLSCDAHKNHVFGTLPPTAVAAALAVHQLRQALPRPSQGTQRIQPLSQGGTRSKRRQLQGTDSNPLVFQTLAKLLHHPPHPSRSRRRSLSAAGPFRRMMRPCFSGLGRSARPARVPPAAMS